MSNILKKGIDYDIVTVEHVSGEATIFPVTRSGFRLNRICEPNKNSVVYTYNPDSEEFIPVLILDGEWLSNGRLSNWWTWQELNDNLELGEIKSGYGGFYKPEKEFKVETTFIISAVGHEG